MAASERPTQIKALAGARALPPLVLVLFHFCESHGYRGWHLFDVFVCKGYLWVEFFFVLSGFVLAYVYRARAVELWQGRNYMTFMQTRLARLYPLHLFTLLVILTLVIVLRTLAHFGGYTSIYDQAYHPLVKFWGFIANIFLVQAWNLFPTLTWNTVAWFVSVEFLLCLLFPIYLSLSLGGWWRGLIFVIAGGVGLTLLDLTNKHGLDITFHNGIFRGMADFAIGVGFANLYEHLRERGLALSALIHSIVQLLIVAAFFYAIYHSGWSHQWKDIYVVPPMMALIFALSFDKGIVAQFMQTRPMLQFGEWSYAIYLGQIAWLQFSRFVQQRFYPPADTMVMGYRWPDFIWWLEPGVILIICVIWGALLATYIETPANRFLRRKISHQNAAAKA